MGCGPHGVAVGCALVQAGIAGVGVVDPETGPLAVWQRGAAGIAMTQMRSPWVHHVQVDAMGLLDFAHAGQRWQESPSVAEFEAHALAHFDRYRPRIHRGRVVGLRRGDRPRPRWTIELDDGRALHAHRVVVATGLGPHRRPDIGGVALPGGRVGTHRGAVAVIGGGHTATTAAAALLRGGATVDLFAPRALTEQAKDVDPGWFGPRYLDGFARTCSAGRLDQLFQARFASTPPGLAAWLREQAQGGQLRIVGERVARVEAAAVGTFVRSGRRWGPYEQAYCATGHRIDVANLDWLVPWVGQTLSGWPVLDPHLQAAPGLHLTGPLAELELGPAGRNLWGAQRAATCVLAAVRLDEDRALRAARQP